MAFLFRVLLFSLSVHLFCAFREQQLTYNSFLIKPSAQNQLNITIPSINSTRGSYTLDFTFRMSPTSGSGFEIMRVGQYALNQTNSKVEVGSTPCQFINPFRSNHWYQVSITLTDLNQFHYYLGSSQVCTDLSPYPSSSLNSFKLFSPTTMNTGPVSLTFHRVAFWSHQIDDLLTSNSLCNTCSSFTEPLFTDLLYYESFEVSPIGGWEGAFHWMMSLQSLNQEFYEMQQIKVAAPTGGKYLSQTVNQTGVTWPYNFAFTSYNGELPLTISLWTYLEDYENSTLITFEYGPTSIQRTLGALELACTRGSTSEKFNQHFSNTYQIQQWSHISCVVDDSSIFLAYGYEWAESTGLTYTITSAASVNKTNQKVSLGAINSTGYYLREVRVYSQALTQGEILLFQNKMTDSFSNPGLILYLELRGDTHTESINDRSASLLHFIPSYDNSTQTDIEYSWLSPGVQAPIICAAHQYVVLRRCESSLHFINFSALAAPLSVSVPLINNQPSAAGVYEIWILIDKISPSTWIFHHQHFAALGVTSQSLVVFESPFLQNSNETYPKAIIASKWHHVAVSISGSTIVILLDGQDQNYSGQNLSPQIISSGTLTLGAHPDIQNSNFTGYMAQLRIWKSRSKDELRRYFHRSVTSSSSELQGYWKLLPILEDILPDLSDNRNHIDISGIATLPLSPLSEWLPVCQDYELYKGSHCDDQIYLPIITTQVQQSASLSLKLEGVVSFSFSFYLYIAQSGVTPQNVYFMKTPDLQIDYNTSQPTILDIDICGTSAQHNATFIHDQWLRFTFYTNSSSSFYLLGQFQNATFQGPKNCPTPLGVKILNSDAASDHLGVYMRDLTFYPSSVLPSQLIRWSYSHSRPEQSQIDVYYPISIPQRSIKNRAGSLYSYNTLEYNDPHRFQLQASLYGAMDLYRWKYSEGISDQVTQCDQFYILRNGYCQPLKYLENNSFTIQSSALPTNFTDTMKTGDIGVSAWIRYTNDTLDSTQQILDITAGSEQAIAGAISEASGKVRLGISPGSTTIQAWNFYEFKDQWKYIALVRSNTSEAYAINGKYYEIEGSVQPIGSASYTLSIGGSTSKFLGAVGRVTLFLPPFSESLFIRDMFFGQDSSDALIGATYPILLTNQLENKVYGIDGDAGMINLHTFSLTGSYLQSEPPITSFLRNNSTTHPLFSEVFKTTLEVSFPGAVGVWLLVTQATSQFLLFLTLYTSQAQIDRWVEIFLKSEGTTSFQYKSVESMELAHSMSVAKWSYLQFHATTSQMVGILDERIVRKSISESLVILQSPIVLQLSPVSIITKYSFQHLRVFNDDLSDPNTRLDYFSHYLQLSHKSLSTFAHFEDIPSLQTNLAFYYLQELDGVYYFALMNNTVSSPFEIVETSAMTVHQQPVQCSLDQFYNGIECQAEKSQVVFTGQTRPLQLIMPATINHFSIFSWIYITALKASQQNALISVLSSNRTFYFSVGVNSDNQYAHISTSQASCTDTSSAVTMPLKQWIPLSLNIDTGVASLYSIDASHSFLQECLKQANYTLLQAFGLITEQASFYQTSHGSIKYLSLFNSTLDITEIRSYMAGTLPDPFSPIQTTSLQSLYLLDGSDISSNRELILNQASGDWEAIGGMLNNTAAPDSAPRFANSRILTLLNMQQLPTCLLQDGLYLDTSLKVCKQFERTVLSPLDTDLKFFIPPSEKNSTSWTLHFWLYYGVHNETNYPLTLLSYKIDQLPNTVALSWNASLFFTHNQTLMMSGIRGYIFQGRWNSITLVCSEPALEDKCQFIPNFMQYPGDTSSVYLGPLFYRSSHELTLNHTSGIMSIALLKGWSTVLGGSLANVRNALKSIAFSIHSEPQDFLLLYYPLLQFSYFDTFKRDKIIGFSQTKFSYHWLSTSSDVSSQPLGSKEQKVWNITEFQIPSISATFNSTLETGFTA